MSAIYVLRHAQSVGNADPRLYSTMFNPEMPLSPQGEEEADRAGLLIKKNIDNTAIAIFSSHYLRTVQTAEIISKHVGNREVRQNVFLAEKQIGDQEGCNDIDDFKARPLERHAYAKAGHLTYTPIRGESLLDVQMRMALFVLQQDSFRFMPTTILVSHRDACIAMHSYLTGEIPKSFEDSWGNCEVRRYTAKDDMKFVYEGKLE